MNCIKKLVKHGLSTSAVTIFVGMLGLALPATTAHAQTFTPIRDFGLPVDNGSPGGLLTQGRDGNLYGFLNGSGNAEIFQITTAGVETLQFASNTGQPTNCSTGMILGTDGNFYGTCREYLPDHLGGVAFKFTPGIGALSGTFTILADIPAFTQVNGTAEPNGPIQAADGNLYFTTEYDPNNTGSGCGYAYKLTTAGVLTTLHIFAGSSVNQPCGTIGPLIQGKDGNLYGTSIAGGKGGLNFGTVYKLTTAGTASVVYSFTAGALDGRDPMGGVIQGADNNLYGTARDFGVNNGGTIFKVSLAGTFLDLHNFNTATEFGGFPNQPLIQATDNNLYSVASGCVGNNCGTTGNIFKSTTTGAYTTEFGGFDETCGSNPDGCIPNSPLTQHTNGTFYGVTAAGPAGFVGVFYSFALPLPLGKFVSIQQKSGNVAATVNILGQGFIGTASVKFGGVAATSFTVVSDTFMTAKVPAGAISGKVTVVEPSGTLTSAQTFSVKARITSFTPASGPVGTLVTINGTGLTQVSKVTFNNVVATSFTIVSDSKITATVPTGATTGKIVVTNPAGTASSATSFTVI